MTNGQRWTAQQVLASRELGGAALMALELAGFLQREGHAGTVWAPAEGPALQEVQRRGLSGRVFDGATLFGRGLVPSALTSWRLGRALRTGGPGLVHVHGVPIYGALRHGLWLSGLPCVVHVQGQEDEAGLRWALRRPPELIVTCARFLEEYVRRTLPERARERQWIAAVPNAVNTQRFFPADRQEARRQLGVPAGLPLVLMLANLAPHKGQETVIAAVAALKQRGLDVVCWLAGTERGGAGTYTERLRSLIRAAGVEDRVQLLGFRTDTPALLQAADFFLLPSTCEGLPLSILEAQATGVPVLAAPTAGIPEAVRDGETGFLIPAGDADGYAEVMARLLQQPALCRRVSEQALAWVTQEYTTQTFCTRLLDLYRQLLARSARAPRRRSRVAAG